MSAFVIMIREKTRDTDAMAHYAELASATRQNHEFTPLAFYGEHETVEGGEAEGVVILEFDSMVSAKAWYESYEYSDAKQHRFQGADYRVIIVNGV